MTIASFPFYYLSLDLPKTIINDAISGTRFPVDASIELLGFELNFGSYEQVPYLLLLCFAFLLLVLINSGFKLFINIYRGVLGERMLRRLRYQLIDRIMKFPLGRFRRTSQGELVSMVNQETEPLGGFIGEAFSLPLYQGGLLLTILIFMFVQDWKLGLAAIALYPVQAWLIPKLQRRVNLLNLFILPYWRTSGYSGRTVYRGVGCSPCSLQGSLPSMERAACMVSGPG